MMVLDFNLVFDTETEDVVLILVLLDDGLGPVPAISLSVLQIVLILVLLDDGLGRGSKFL